MASANTHQTRPVKRTRKLQTHSAEPTTARAEGETLSQVVAKVRETLDQVLDGLSTELYIIDLDFNLIYMNKASACPEDTDRDPAPSGKCHDGLCGPSCNTEDCPMARALAGDRHFEREITCPCENNIAAPRLLRAWPFKNSSGQLLGIVAEYRNLMDSRHARQHVTKVEIALRERIKELKCLYQISQLAERHGDSVDELLQGIVALLPESWLHPEVTCGRIVLYGQVYATPNFMETPWGLVANILVEGQEAGTIEVRYLVEKPDLHEGPFSQEERSLLDAVASRTGKIVERIHAQQQVLVEHDALTQKDTALKEVLAGIQEEKKEIGRAVLANVEKTIMPVLDALKRGLRPQQQQYVDLLRDGLHQITSPFITELSKQFERLTPKEVRICDFIRKGLSSKEIAVLENISPETMRTHRFQIRHKLGLVNKAVNLATFLQRAMSRATDRQG